MTETARPKTRSPQSEPAARPDPEPRARTARTRFDDETFIDAEFVEVLRESAKASATIDPADETLRQALDAYRKAAQPRFIVGAMIDFPT